MHMYMFIITNLLNPNIRSHYKIKVIFVGNFDYE